MENTYGKSDTVSKDMCMQIILNITEEIRHKCKDKLDISLLSNEFGLDSNDIVILFLEIERQFQIDLHVLVPQIYDYPISDVLHDADD